MHLRLRQSLFETQALPVRHFVQVAPPQSMSVSAPSVSLSVQIWPWEGAADLQQGGNEPEIIGMLWSVYMRRKDGILPFEGVCSTNVSPTARSMGTGASVH